MRYILIFWFSTACLIALAFLLASYLAPSIFNDVNDRKFFLYSIGILVGVVLLKVFQYFDNYFQ